MARGYVPPVNEEERLFVRRVKELAYAVQGTGAPRKTAFLSDRQQTLASAALSSAGFSNYHFDGGYPEAERKLLYLHGARGAGEAPPLCLLLRAEDGQAAPAHRDYLGALLALGVKRECVGDIVPCEGGAYVFLLATIAPLVREELRRAGRSAVRVFDARPEELPRQRERAPRTATVASLRLDAVLAAMLHISRSDAAGLIKSGAVEINHVPTASIHAEVYAGDTFSVRGYGKYHLSEIGSQSRKGRTFVSYFEY